MAKIIGNTTATPNPRPDWAQTDETKADYIKNKPIIGDVASLTEISKDNLALDVQESLNKADSAVQSLDGYAKETYVDAKVASLVDAAPETLDTLKELSAALGDDPNFATTIATEIGKKIDESDLDQAIDIALAQAKASGEFDGVDGKDGADGKDGYTPIKGVDYFNEADKEEILDAPRERIYFTNGISVGAAPSGSGDIMVFDGDNNPVTTWIWYGGDTYATEAEWAYYASSDDYGNYIPDTYATKEELGDIETALDNIIAIQNTLIGGDSV